MQQNWDASQYHDHAGFVSEYGLPVIQLLKPVKGERILDLGCGDGTLAREMKNAGMDVHCVDSSPSMINAARQKGLSAEVMSSDELSYTSEFDAVFSNAALHWMTQADTVIQNVFRALKPGGRFVGEMGGAGNIASLLTAMEQVFAGHPEFGPFHNPWFFPTQADYAKRLQKAGFAVEYIELIKRPTPLASGVNSWLQIFSEGITQQLNASQKTQFLVQVEDAVKSKLFDGNSWVADYVRLRFYARKT